MRRHSTDVLALLFGLAFAISAALVAVTQATSVEVSPQWGAAVGLIVLGAVALAATVTRAQTGPTIGEAGNGGSPAGPRPEEQAG